MHFLVMYFLTTRRQKNIYDIVVLLFVCVFECACAVMFVFMLLLILLYLLTAATSVK